MNNNMAYFKKLLHYFIVIIYVRDNVIKVSVKFLIQKANFRIR
ncbi:hypothetical protein MBUL_03030 [Methylobacterium bullatum]|uniref:Uncharacterized protein n=1 Tax=Methylobacterium bullatum TaxID=570505 RepID=A0A679JFI0_9HYPH|nr:hypothetical protein MBUL_03030 [Methylobacterium bullatum]